MSKAKITTTDGRATRAFPKLKKTGEGSFSAEVPDNLQLEQLLGMRTVEAAKGVYLTAIGAMGQSAEKFGSLASAMFAELEPQDAIEAMLIAQMTATHVAMTHLSERLSYQTAYQVRESYERSITRLSRTYLAQMDALKKHRAKAQQIVRVERVTVNEGGQAIVGDVSHAGGR
ncbi:hypothetical protein [Falsihalocynthiibacter sp. CO-5D18]|uniref:hypothetical protein n=1 Tax=Falsihalocynthiibacter sp. CO-5D18 TaxID=3240872 RepID=UPI0035102959